MLLIRFQKTKLKAIEVVAVYSSLSFGVGYFGSSMGRPKESSSPSAHLVLQSKHKACNAHGIYCIPLYDTLGAGAVEFIICQAEVSIAFVEERKIPEQVQNFGEPFFLILRDGETLAEVKVRIQKKLQVPTKSSLSGNLYFCHWVALSTSRTVISCQVVFREEMFMEHGSSTLGWSTLIVLQKRLIPLIRTVIHMRSR